MPVAEQVTLDPNYGIGVFSASSNGVLAYQSGSKSKSKLHWLDLNGRSLGASGKADTYDELAVSPDGTKAVVVINESDGIRDLWVIDLAQGTRTRLTFSTKETSGVHSGPVWSPDGREIAFGLKREGTNDIFRKPVDGSGEAVLVLDLPDDLWVYDWSPDGKYLLYGHERPEHNGAEDLYVIPVSGEGEPVRLFNTPFNEWPGRFSPDGRWLAYDSPESGRREIYVVPFPPGEGRWQVSTEGGRYPNWSPDSRRLYFSNGARMMMVPLQTSGDTLRVGAATEIFKLSEGAAYSSYDLSSDGERFLALVADQTMGPPTLSLFLNWKTELESR